MGFLIFIKKENESSESVLYSFETPEGDFGKIIFFKVDGDIQVLEEPKWDKENKLALRVGLKLREHWRKGEYPDTTCWA